MSEPGPDAPHDGAAAAAVAVGDPLPEEPESGAAPAARASLREPAPAPLGPLLAAFGLDLLLALVLIAGLTLLGTAGWGFVQGLRGAAVAQAAPNLTAAMLITLSATAISALAVYYFRRNANAVERRASWQALWRISSWGWIATAPIVLTTCTMLAAATALSMGLDVTPTNQVLGPAMRAQPALWLAIAVLVAPAYEELLFRRVLFGRLWAAGRPWLGLVLSSVAFALVHEPPGLGADRGAGVLVLWGVYALMGAVFAWIYRRTGSLWVAYLAHAGNNLIASLPLLAGS